MKKSTFVSALSMISLLLLGIVQPVLALSEVTDKVKNELSETTKTVTDEVNRSTERGEKIATAETKKLQKMLQRKVAYQKLQASKYCAHMKTKIAKMKATKSLGLDGKRLETCQKREQRINNLLTNSANFSQKKLNYLQDVKKKVTAFYESKQLSSDVYSSALDTVNDKEAIAVAAVESFGTVKYDCSNVDSDKPGAIISSMALERRQTLQDYRKAVKQLIGAVRESIRSASSTEGSL